MPNKNLLLRFGELKLQEKQIANEIKLIKDQVQKEVETLLGETEEHLQLNELPGCTFLLAKAPAKWEYSPQTTARIKELDQVMEDEQKTGDAIDLNADKKVLKFNLPKE